jgi:hypothetical protein
MLSVAAIAHGEAFINPPCLNWPEYWMIDGDNVYNPWVSQFPYQRNVLYTFDNALDPTQPHYEGYDDPVLYPSDFVEVVGLDHYEADPLGTGRRGLYGIDNRQGTQDLEGYILFHLDNWQEPRPWKHIWKEIIFVMSDPTPTEPKGALVEENVTVPSGFEVKGIQTVYFTYLNDNYILEDMAAKVYPNCPWEEIYVLLSVPAGGYAFVDEVHFATECVPEPTTLTLLALGGGALAWLRRRRRS